MKTDSNKSACYYINIGRYNLCSNEKQACLQLITSGGNFSALFDIDDAPDIDGLLPSEILTLIEEKLIHIGFLHHAKKLKNALVNGDWNNMSLILLGFQLKLRSQKNILNH